MDRGNCDHLYDCGSCNDMCCPRYVEIRRSGNKPMYPGCPTRAVLYENCPGTYERRMKGLYRSNTRPCLFFRNGGNNAQTQSVIVDEIENENDTEINIVTEPDDDIVTEPDDDPPERRSRGSLLRESVAITLSPPHSEANLEDKDAGLYQSFLTEGNRETMTHRSTTTTGPHRSILTQGNRETFTRRSTTVPHRSTTGGSRGSLLRKSMASTPYSRLHSEANLEDDGAGPHHSILTGGTRETLTPRNASFVTPEGTLNVNKTSFSLNRQSKESADILTSDGNKNVQPSETDIGIEAEPTSTIINDENSHKISVTGSRQSVKSPEKHSSDSTNHRNISVSEGSQENSSSIVTAPKQAESGAKSSGSDQLTESRRVTFGENQSVVLDPLQTGNSDAGESEYNAEV